MNNNPIIAYLYTIEDVEHMTIHDFVAEYLANRLDYHKSRVWQNLELSHTDETYGYNFLFKDPVTKKEIPCTFSDYLVSIDGEYIIDPDWIHKIYKSLDSEDMANEYMSSAYDFAEHMLKEEIKNLKDEYSKLTSDFARICLNIYKPDEDDSSSELEK